jgi:hypothetical protein
MLLILISAWAMPLSRFDSAADLGAPPEHFAVLPAGEDFEGYRVLASSPQYGPDGGALVAVPLDDAPWTFPTTELLITSVDFSFGKSFDVADLDGDGLNDLVISHSEYLTDGRVHIFYGGAHTWPATDLDADAVLLDDVAGGGLGYSVKAVPDMTGDGLPDLLLQQLVRSSRQGREQPALWLVPGGRYVGDMPIDMVPGTFRYDGTSNDVLGADVTWMEDVDGDLLPEIVARLNRFETAVLLSGHRLQVQDVRSNAVILAINHAELVKSVMTHADIDGDGQQELLIGGSARDQVPGADAEGGIYVVPHNLPWTPGTTLNLPPVAARWWVPVNCARLGQTIARLPDLDGDGDDEIVSTAIDPRSGLNQIILLRGAPNLAHRGMHTPAWEAMSSTPQLRMWMPLLMVGDADGDGRDDVVFDVMREGRPDRYGLLRFGL